MMKIKQVEDEINKMLKEIKKLRQKEHGAKIDSMNTTKTKKPYLKSIKQTIKQREKELKTKKKEYARLLKYETRKSVTKEGTSSM